MAWATKGGGDNFTIAATATLTASATAALAVGDIILVPVQYNTLAGATGAVITAAGVAFTRIAPISPISHSQQAELWLGKVTGAGAKSVQMQYLPVPGTTTAAEASIIADPFSGSGADSVFYQSTFPADENPISEAGVWRNTDPTTTKVKTVGGSAYGTQADGPYSPYDDSSAYVVGIVPHYEIEAVVRIPNTALADDPHREVELLLRWTDDGGQYAAPPYGVTSVRGYEINWHHNGAYGSLTRFKDAGPVLQNFLALPDPVDGDVFKARIEGQRITSFVNATSVIDYTDKAAGFLKVGYPGMGFFWRTGASNLDIGFASIKITALPTVPDWPGASAVRVAPGAGADAITTGVWQTTVDGDLIYGAFVDTSTGANPGAVGTGFTALRTTGGVILKSMYKVQVLAANVAVTATAAVGADDFLIVGGAVTIDTAPPPPPPPPSGASGPQPGGGHSRARRGRGRGRALIAGLEPFVQMVPPEVTFERETPAIAVAPAPAPPSAPASAPPAPVAPTPALEGWSAAELAARQGPLLVPPPAPPALAPLELPPAAIPPEPPITVTMPEPRARLLARDEADARRALELLRESGALD